MTDATGIIVRIFFIMFALLQGESMLVSARANDPVEEFLSEVAHSDNIVAGEMQLKFNGNEIQLESVVETYKEHVDAANSYEEDSLKKLGKELNKSFRQYIDVIIEATVSLISNIHLNDLEFFAKSMELKTMLINLRDIASHLYTNINTETLERFMWMKNAVQAKPIVKRWTPIVQVLQKKVLESDCNGKDRN